MADAMNPLPTEADDPRLEGWYHTIELAPGIWTRNAAYDHRPILNQVGLPSSLEGKTALDLGTADGFWAFEMERRGAERVVAFDIAQLGDSDVLPRYRAKLPPDWAAAPNYCASRFWTAHAMRQSRVEYRTGSIYDLSPEMMGQFDIVYCGSLLVHLFNPLQALINIRSVTREMALIEVCSFDPDYDPVEPAFPDRPYAWFGSLNADAGEPGKNCMYWRFSQRGLHDLLIYAGFAAVESRGHYRIAGPGGEIVPSRPPSVIPSPETSPNRKPIRAGRATSSLWPNSPMPVLRSLDSRPSLAGSRTWDRVRSRPLNACGGFRINILGSHRSFKKSLRFRPTILGRAEPDPVCRWSSSGL